MGSFLKAQQNLRCVRFSRSVRAHTAQHRGRSYSRHDTRILRRTEKRKTLSADSRCVLRFRFVCSRCCVSNLITKPGGIFASFCQIYCQTCSRFDFARVQVELSGRTIRSFAPIFHASPWFRCKPLEINFNWFPAQSTNRIIYEHLVLEFPRRRRSVSLIEPISALKKHWWVYGTGKTLTIWLH